MNNPYVAVLLGDQNPHHALDWNKFEKEHILKKMKIDSNSCVLDIGCGIGRWAESIIPISKYYLGTDFSAEMINVAKQRCKYNGCYYDFINTSFQKLNQITQKKFNRVIICGVCISMMAI